MSQPDRVKKKLGTFLENKVFQKSKFSEKEINKSWSPSPIFFTEKQHLNFEMFEEVVHNFGKSDSDIIFKKKCSFPLDGFMPNSTFNPTL